MPRSSVTQRPSAPMMQDSFNPDDLLPELQATLAALADVEFRYGSAREYLRAWTGPNAVRQHLLAQLDERYQQECERYTRRLADLHDRLLKAQMLQDICSAD